MKGSTTNLLVVAMVSIFTTVFSFIAATTFYDHDAPVLYTAIAGGTVGIGVMGLIYCFCRLFQDDY